MEVAAYSLLGIRGQGIFADRLVDPPVHDGNSAEDLEYQGERIGRYSYLKHDNIPDHIAGRPIDGGGRDGKRAIDEGVGTSLGAVSEHESRCGLSERHG